MRIFAYRGSSGTHPENTLAAFRAAAQLPISGVKVEVHLTKDEEMVVIHDEAIDRTTNGHGYVKDMTLAQLKKYDCGSWFSPEWSGERIPTLEEVFDEFAETGHILNIELKSDIFPYDSLMTKVLELAEKKGLTERLMLSSFNHEDIQRACRETSIPSAILTFGVYVDVYDYARVIGTNRLHVTLPSAFRKMTTDALRKGAIVYAYPVNDLEYAKELKQIGVHGIFTDYPEFMMKELE